MTLTEGIKAAIEDAIPEIDRVVDVTDHAAGENPFYAQA
jgi:Fe/S biogenesis protein NfuA